MELQNKYITKTTKQPRIGKVENLRIVIPCVGIYLFFKKFQKMCQFFKIFVILSFSFKRIKPENSLIIILFSEMLITF